MAVWDGAFEGAWALRVGAVELRPAVVAVVGRVAVAVVGPRLLVAVVAERPAVVVVGPCEVVVVVGPRPGELVVGPWLVVVGPRVPAEDVALRPALPAPELEEDLAGAAAGFAEPPPPPLGGPAMTF